MRVPVQRSPLEWAEEKRILQSDSAERGPYKSSRTPYLIPVAKAFSDPRYSIIVLRIASQMGKTEFCLACVGRVLDEAPAPVLYVCPTQRLVESISTNRVDKMLRSIPSLWKKTAKGKRYKIGEKYVSGVMLRFCWCTAVELCSHSAGLGILDELNRMPRDVDGEGSPVELVKARLVTFQNSKLLMTSSPTVEGDSPICAHFEQGTKQIWHIPCPQCGQFFAPCLAMMHWDDQDGVVERAWLECPECKLQIEDRYRRWLNEHGLYLGPGQTVQEGQVMGELPGNEIASFSVSGIVSPWRSFKRAAAEFVNANRSGDPGRIQGVINTVFGESWRIRGEAPEPSEVYLLRQEYDFGQLPKECQVITCGVDVQKLGLYFAVWAWGFAGEAWLVDYGYLDGDTEGLAVWERLQQAVLQKEFGSQRGRFCIRLMAIDSGFRSNLVYWFSGQHPGRTISCKGHINWSSPVSANQIEINARGERNNRGIKLFHFDAFYFKCQIHGKIKRRGTGPGTWHLPQGIDEDFVKQLTSEELVTKATGGQVWIQQYRHNHLFDCCVLNEVAGYVLRVNHLSKDAPEGGAKVLFEGIE